MVTSSVQIFGEALEGWVVFLALSMVELEEDAKLLKMGVELLAEAMAGRVTVL